MKNLSVLMLFLSLTQSTYAAKVVTPPPSSKPVKVVIPCPRVNGSLMNVAMPAGWAYADSCKNSAKSCADLSINPSSAELSKYAGSSFGQMKCLYDIKDIKGLIHTYGIVYGDHVGEKSLSGFNVSHCSVSGASVICNK